MAERPWSLHASRRSRRSRREGFRDRDRAGVAHCDAHVRTDLFGDDVHPTACRDAGAPIPARAAYGPAYLQSAYNAPSATNGTGQTVAIVDAYDDPNVEADLATYRVELRPAAVHDGQRLLHARSTRPAAPTTRRRERGLGAGDRRSTSTWSSAICPNCHILLVEATRPRMSNLGTAVNEAVALGAERREQQLRRRRVQRRGADDTAYYNHPGVAITASSGDSGYGVEYPAASPTLSRSAARACTRRRTPGRATRTETVWSGAGSGCSALRAQARVADRHRLRASRTVADVSAVADPNTGVWVY